MERVRSMGILNFFKKKEPSHSEKVSIAYRCYKADMVDMIFPDGIRQADKIICSLAKIYGLQLDSLDGVSYHDILTTYTDVIIRKVITQSDNGMILVSLQTQHSNLVKSPEMAQRVLAYTNLNMLDHSFALECEADMKLLSEEVVADNDEFPEKQDTIELGFYFENVLELAIYGKLFGKEKTVNWLSGDAYLNQFQKGFQLVEQGKFVEAIKVLKASLSLNPIGISARFEMCECFIQLKDFFLRKKSWMTWLRICWTQSILQSFIGGGAISKLRTATIWELWHAMFIVRTSNIIPV